MSLDESQVASVLPMNSTVYRIDQGVGTLGTQAACRAGVEVSRFGQLDDGRAIDIYVLRNSIGAIAKVMPSGATLTELWMPDRTAMPRDVALGFDNLQSYLGKHPWFGATVGRVANRIANGKFTLDGKEYQLATNDKPNHLHGGDKGFDKVVW